MLLTNVLHPLTHLPAPAVAVRGRLVQVCAICGKKLIDKPFDETAEPLPEESLVRQDYAGGEYTVSPFAEPLPPDFCLNGAEAMVPVLAN